jgi:flavorubredoxin/flavin reductase (DIM6/NTAB) family NADH-FMN oxidoreductase RutF
VGEGTASKSEWWSGLTPGKDYELSMFSQEIAENTRTIRSHDWERDRFDIEFALTNGTTYNSYTIKGETGTALIDASHKKFEPLFMDSLESPDGGDIDLATLDYIVVSHTEPDHSGLIENILKKAEEKGNDKITVVGSKICINFLQNLMHMDFKSKVVKDGDTIDLGGGHELEFLLTPNLHWPDTICTYDRKTELLYTCDIFGMHYCSKEITDVEGVDELKPHYQLYYDCLMKPNAKSATTALKKLPKLAGPVSAVCTGHGPILTHHKDEWLNMYQTWSEDALKKLGPAVCIFWVSRHGESERLSQSLAFGLTSNDVLVEMHDLNAIDAFEVVEACGRNQVIVVFAPPMTGIAEENLSSIVASCNEKNHKFLVSASFGENEDPVDSIVSRFVQVGIPEAMPALRLLDGSPEKHLVIYEEHGLLLAKKLLEKKKQAAKDKLNEKTMKALGKMGGGRYIITASKAEVNCAGAATWVMPASTEPPSVAMAIAKEDALQTVMQVGDTFVVNMLEEGNYLPLLKHFQQSFAPGADVLEGIETFPVEGGSALKGGCAFLTCKVSSRMDASDHVIICSEVMAGEVLREAPIAANYRKTAAYY